ncbi:hypothetical protein ACSW0U_000269 [Vibrio fluvialis]|uniref:hypothetical protein n=1 Tax=Vibrio fluvialis TaxID=676 RepID=UPI001302EC12|nr:hypothetical protein [Vibrio fluvialis]
MKEIRFFHRRFNFTSKPGDRVKCEHSLAHSLRIAPPTAANKAKKLEWNKELAGSNLIWLGSNILSLNSVSEEERLELLYQFAPEPKIRNQSKLQTQQRQYRLKIKKAIESETSKGNVDVAKFLQNILNTKGHVSYSRIEQFKKLPMQRKGQRIKMLETYLNAYNQLQQRPAANHVFLQEGIFKVPHQWNVSNDTITLEEYILFTRKFLKHHYPAYDIQAIIGHDDERSVDVNTGAHTHYFISGRNNQTGEYDLRKTQINVVNEYIRENYPSEKLLPENGKLTRKLIQKFGHYHQRMMLDFSNEQLFKSKSLKAEFAPETEQKSALRKKIDKEANLPKSARSHNYYTHQLELVQAKVHSAEQQYNELVENTHSLKDNFDKLLNDVAQVQVNLSELQIEKDTVTTEITELKDQQSRLSQLALELTDAIVPRLVSVFKKVLLAINARDNKVAKKQAEYLDSAFSVALELPPSVAQGITREIEAIKKTNTTIEAEASMDK